MSYAQDSVSVEEHVVPRRHRWSQFSLHSLVLLIVIGCVAAAWLGENRRRLAEKRRRHEAEQMLIAKHEENRRLQIELGIWDDGPSGLRITDPKLVHVSSMPEVVRITDRATARRWKIYLPPGTKWRFGVDCGSDWDEVQLRYRDSNPALRQMFPGLKGELTLDTYLFRRLDGTAKIVISRGRSTSGSILPEQAVAAVLRSGKLTEQTTGRSGHGTGVVHKQVTFDPTGRIVLMRWHREFSELAKETDVDGEPLPDQYGFAIFLEEASAK